MSKGFETLADIIPESIGRDSQVRHCIRSIDPYLHAVAEGKDLPAIYKRLGELSSGQMDHMAAQMDVDVWRTDWDMDRKRSMLIASYDVKRHAGTVQAVRDVLASMGVALQLTEWWQKNPQGTPHTFTIMAVASGSSGNGELTAEEQQDLILGIDRAKPVRSHYELIIQTAHKGGMIASAHVRHTIYARVSNL